MWISLRCPATFHDSSFESIETIAPTTPPWVVLWTLHSPFCKSRVVSLSGLSKERIS